MTQEEMIDEYYATEWSMFQVFPKQEKVEGHPSEDQTSRWPADRKLRAHGCKIAYRPRRLEAVWNHPTHGYRSESAMLALLGGKALKGGLAR